MTVRTQLETAHGTHRVYYLAIDGLEPYLFQRSSKGVPSGWSRSTMVCFEPTHETTMGLDLGKMRADLSQLTFRLGDIEDLTDLGTSYFGKLFSTGRWNNNPHVRMTEATNYGTYLDANATSIPIKSNVGFTSPSAGYIGQEAINWTSANADTIHNVSRGMYSAVNVSQPWGHTYARPVDGGKGYTYNVSTVPFSFVGRRVALYLTTWDPIAEGYRAESESELIWTGRADDQIQQDGRTGVWSLSCKSILQELDRQIPVDFPESTLEQINCWGPKGLIFVVYFHDKNGALRVYKFVQIPPGWYTIEKLVAEISSQLWYGWIDVSKPKYDPTMSCSIDSSIGQPGKVSIFGQTGYGEGPGSFTIHPAYNGETCHPLGALGFDTRDKTYIEASTASDLGRYRGSVQGDTIYTSYHPIHQDHNGGKMRVTEPLRFWADQGDDPGMSQAAVMIEDATLAPFWNLTVDEGNYYARYTTRDKATRTLTLTTDPAPQVSRDGFVGAKYGDKAIVVKQIYIPKYLQASKNKKGPFELLLTPLLSTGTQGYNGTYDRAPLELGMGIQQDLVDVDSFLSADKAIMGNSLAHRVMWPIVEQESFLDLVSTEGQLFGYALVWRSGKLTVSPVLQPSTETWTVHLTDENMVDPNEFPKVTQSVKTVVNQYLLDIHYSPTEGKFGGSYTVTDVDSVIGTTVTKQIKIKHSGVYLKGSKSANIIAALKTLLLGRFIRFPLPILDRSLAPTLLNKIFVGDMVKVTSSRIQDPFGSGSRTMTGFAVVLDCKWNHKTGKGSARLMLLDWPGAAAWSPSALVDVSAANGGFDTASNSLILKQHTWSTSGRKQDGQALAEYSGWDVVVIERAPVDPTSATIHGPFKVGAYTPADRAMQLNSAPAGWDATIEHVVTFADFDDCNSDQYDDDKGTWQANPDSELLNSATKAQRYR